MRQVRALGLTVPAERDLGMSEGKRSLRPAGTLKVPRPQPTVPPATGVAHLGDPSVEARIESEGSIVSCEYRALLSGSVKPRLPAILCHADRCSRAAVRVRMSRNGYEGLSVAEAAVRLTERHGTKLTMKLMAEHAGVWSGAVQLYSVEITGDAKSEVLLTFAFEHPLSEDESERLGLAA